MRKSLANVFKNKWKNKLRLLCNIINGLDSIHQLKFVHRDFHDGNILYHDNLIRISDLGLSQPVSSEKNNIYGIISFTTPKVLRSQPYSLASDIYSFSITMWEFTSGILSFNDRNYDFYLIESICKGKYLEIIENTPQCYINLMKRCWDDDPPKRPTASEISDTLTNWIDGLEGFMFNEKLGYNVMEFNQADTLPTFEYYPKDNESRPLYSEKLNDILDEALNVL